MGLCSNAPPPQNYNGAAEKGAQANQQATDAQTRANRPNQSNPFSTSQWTQGPDGQWTQNTSFNGALGGLNDSLQQQAAQAMGTPFSLGGLPALTSGADARQQAIDAAYGDATKRLDPQFQQREQQLRSQLLGQGLQEGSEAYNTAFANLNGQRNDAYNSAMNSAIGQGTAAGSALFNQSMAARQQGLSELLRQRGQAFGELQGMQGLTQQQSFMGANRADSPDYLRAAGMQGQDDFNRYAYEQQQIADYINGGAQLAGSILPFALCDARAKDAVTYLSTEMLPGVHLATWRYRPEYGDPSRLFVGVIAQDLQRVAPEHVRERGDGMLTVHPDFAPLELA